MTAPTREEAEQVFAPADLTRVGDLLVDDETGEVLEWPDGVSPEGRLEWLQAQHALSGDQEKRHAQAKGVYGRAIAHELERLGARTYTGGAHKSYTVAGSVVPYAPAARLRDLVGMEAMALAAAKDVMWDVARDLDVKAINALVAAKTLPEPVAEHLIQFTTRAGYTRTDVVAQPAPDVTKEHRA